jgi:hypothetical protein
MMAQRSSCGEDSSSLTFRFPHWLRGCVKGLGGLGMPLWARPGEARQICDSTATTSNPPPTVRASAHPGSAPQLIVYPQNLSILAAVYLFLQRMPSGRGVMFRHVCGRRPACSALATVNFMHGFKLRMSQAHCFPSHPLPHNCLGAVDPLSFFSSLFIVLLSEPALVVPFCPLHLSRIFYCLQRRPISHSFFDFYDTTSKLSHNEVLCSSLCRRWHGRRPG